MEGQSPSDKQTASILAPGRGARLSQTVDGQNQRADGESFETAPRAKTNLVTLAFPVHL